MPSTKTVRDAAAETTKSVLEALEAGTVPWHKPWKATAGAGLPMSLSTNRPYRGVNVFMLMMEGAAKGYGSQYWGTYRQIQERGGQVRKGERSTQVVFWKILRKEEMVDGKAKTRTIPLLRLFHVFNVNQADWAEDARLPATPEPLPPVEAIAHAEALLVDYLSTGPKVNYGGDVACYVPALDEIRMPIRDCFETAEHFYPTLYHEATHSTGSDKRLSREGIAKGTFDRFGGPTYSFEELVAEMGAAMLSAVAGIDQAATLPASASYLAHWIGVLREDNQVIIRAASQAQKAVDLICGTVFEPEPESA